MSPDASLYVYSLIPVLSTAILLGTSAALYRRPRAEGARRQWGLTLYCLALGFWAGALWMAFIPATAHLGRLLAPSGAFAAAGFVHAAYDFTAQRRYGLVWLAYVVAVGFVVFGAVWPGLLYDPVSLTAGPIFWPSMGLTVAAAVLPLWNLHAAWRRADEAARPPLVQLGLSGLLGYAGALTNALLLAHGLLHPIGLYALLASILILVRVVRGQQGPEARRLLDRSLLYSALAVLLSTGVLFGALLLLPLPGGQTSSYGLGALFLVAMAALAVEPLRQHLQERLGRRLIPDRAGGPELAAALTTAEARVDQATRLAELGTFASAVAHEVRNPLGILSTHLKLLERAGVDPEILEEMRGQIHRADRFVEDLLRYGRPRPLELRMIELSAVVQLGWSTAWDALSELWPPDRPAPEMLARLPARGPLIEADQGQLTQAFTILFENATLALADHEGAEAPRVEVELSGGADPLTLRLIDNGPGVPEALWGTLFDPFVTGRKRGARRPGTGLGLPIARHIIEQHGGALRYVPPVGEASGATFEISLPRHAHVLTRPQRLTPGAPA